MTYTEMIAAISTGKFDDVLDANGEATCINDIPSYLDDDDCIEARSKYEIYGNEVWTLDADDRPKTRIWTLVAY